MKVCIRNIFLFLVFFEILYVIPVSADLPLQGKLIVVDAGHGGLDPGTTYKDIYEKDINLNISLFLRDALANYGATVILTRDSDADLSNGALEHRKKTDFDNRIKIINNNFTDIYLSIHLNYLSNTKYYGAQVFYNNDNEILASFVQTYINDNLNSNREIKQIPSSTYMYGKLEKPGVLIECGFLSNQKEREKLVTENYQKEIAYVIANAVVAYYNR